MLEAKIKLGHVDVVKYIEKLIPRVYNLFIHSALVSDGTLLVATEPRLVAVATQVITLVVQTLPAQYVVCALVRKIDLMVL